MRDYESNLSTTVKVKGNMSDICFQTDDTSKIVKIKLVL